ncbi:MAG: tryptophan synthase subunit alpha [Ferruginibacter sp.]
MHNKLTALFEKKNKGILNVFCTAGFPEFNSLPEVLVALQENGADIIEIGIPYSDPLADGPVIQQSNMVALKNGMSLPALFRQLNDVKEKIQVPVILMGYLNPVMQYGLEQFCKDASAAGVAGIIIPDMPMDEYEKSYQSFFKEHGLSFIFLITPQTSEKRIRKADKLSSGFIYAVSSSAVTGTAFNIAIQTGYFKKLVSMELKNPILIGFGIGDKKSFDIACAFAAGAIVGSAYIKALSGSNNIAGTTAEFIKTLKG